MILILTAGSILAESLQKIMSLAMTGQTPTTWATIQRVCPFLNNLLPDNSICILNIKQILMRILILQQFQENQCKFQLQSLVIIVVSISIIHSRSQENIILEIKRAVPREFKPIKPPPNLGDAIIILISFQPIYISSSSCCQLQYL